MSFSSATSPFAYVHLDPIRVDKTVFAVRSYAAHPNSAFGGTSNTRKADN